MEGSSARDEHIPHWTGNPETWQTYKDEVRIWMLGTKLDVEFSLAARLVSKLKGPARRVGLSMADAELEPKRTDPIDLKLGIKNLMSKLETLVPHAQDRRGNYMQEFFRAEKYKRRPAERIPEWITRWEEGAELLQRDGIDLSKLKDLPGWFFLEHANLSEDRCEMVRASVEADEIYNIPVLKATLLRLFPRLHLRERKMGGPRLLPGARPFFRRNTAYETQAEGDENEEEGGEYDEGGWDDEDVGGEGDDSGGLTTAPEVGDFFRGELEALAADLDDAADEDLDDEEHNQLEEAAAILSNAAEALEVVRGMRQRLSAKGRGRGRGGSARGFGGRGEGSKGGTRGQRGSKDGSYPSVPTAPPGSQRQRRGGKAGGRGTSSRADVDRRKSKSKCYVCHRTGHWAGDPECPGPSQESHVVDENPEDAFVVHVLPLSSFFSGPDPVSCLHAQASVGVHAHPDSRHGVVDTACGKSVAGTEWIQDYLGILETFGLRQEAKEIQGNDSFRFGDGRVVQAVRKWVLPVVICGRPMAGPTS